MRKIWSSRKTSWTVVVELARRLRSVPNGFSMITRAREARPASPSVRTTGPAADGGTDR